MQGPSHVIGNPGRSGSVPEAIRTAAGGDSATILVQPAGLKHMALDDQASLLLVTHVSIRQGPYGPEVDEQTAAGIEQWCQHFDRVTFYGVESQANAISGGSASWVRTDEGLLGARARLVILPHAYTPRKMIRHYGAVRNELRQAVATHRHLCFTLGSIIGDWPTIAALEAIEQRRRYAAWIDRVEPFVIRNKLARAPLKRLLAEMVMPFTQAAIRYVLRKSTVALLQGGDSFAYYARSASDPHCTYDTHTRCTEQISASALLRKQDRALAREPLKIVYVGRVAGMKGPFDWLACLARLHTQGIAFQACWIGDGPDLPALKAQVSRAGLNHVIDFPGFEGRRTHLLDRLQESDLLLFCHKTPESARCLIEALVSGCPIIGYDTAYPRGLTQTYGGGLFAPGHSIEKLADHVARLHHDRQALCQLMEAAALSGTLYNEDAVYAHRAALMRRG